MSPNHNLPPGCLLRDLEPQESLDDILERENQMADAIYERIKDAQIMNRTLTSFTRDTVVRPKPMS